MLIDQTKEFKQGYTDYISEIDRPPKEYSLKQIENWRRGWEAAREHELQELTAYDLVNN